MSETFECRKCGASLDTDNWYPSSQARKNLVCKSCAYKHRVATCAKQRSELPHYVSDPAVPECRICHAALTPDNWRTCDRTHNERICVECANRYERIAARTRYIPRPRAKRASRPMNENRQCTLFLGVHVAEQVLSRVFNDVERMPIRNSGYDFICNRGKKIDVKSSCLTKDKRWRFKIDYNQVADFFLMLAFSDRHRLTPKHLWLVPGEDVCHQSAVSTTRSMVHKWDRYALDINRVAAGCKEMRT